MYGISVIVLVLTGSSVRAQEQESLLLNDYQISEIRNNCIATQSILTRIHANDALMRVNQKRQYERILTQLMAPMNSRIALNKLDGVALAQTTVAYKKELDVFVEKYIDYEQTMSDAMQLNCKSQPVAFYDTINVARTKRAAVRESVEKLQNYVRQYHSQFKDFSKTILDEKVAEQQ